MTNFFGLNVTDNQESTAIDGNAFVTKTISTEQDEKLAQLQEDEKAVEQKSNLPLLLDVLKFVFGIVWLIVLLAVLSASSEIRLSEGYQNAPMLYWIGFLCFAAWLVLFIYEKLRKRRTEKTEAFEEHIENKNEMEQKLLQELEIPENAAHIDVLLELYTMKHDKPKHKNMGLTKYMNLDLFAFEQNGNLCLADMEQVWEIPLTSVSALTLEPKRVSFPEWHKPESCRDKKYKSYKITQNNFGHYFSRCYRVEIHDVRGEFYFLVPVYDGETLMRLTHQVPADKKQKIIP